VDYLVSWNCTHIVSGRVRMILEEVNAEFGIRTPIICTPHVQGVRLNYRIFARVESLLWEEPGLRYDAVEPSDNRRCIMAIAVQQIRPLAHLPLILGVLRRLEV